MIQHDDASVAAARFQAPGVVVRYTSDPEIQSGKKFIALGLQTAAGVPLQRDEGADYRSFRVGLGKRLHIETTVQRLANVPENLTAYFFLPPPI
jgi:hypothetical protein